MPETRILPRLTPLNRDFWTGGAENELRIVRCQHCATYLHPPQPVCRNCLSENVAAEPVAGIGLIDTFTVNFQAWTPGLRVPYVIARVQLRDAPDVYLTTNIVNCDPLAVEIGDPVKVVFEQHGGVFLPLFEKVA